MNRQVAGAVLIIYLFAAGSRPSAAEAGGMAMTPRQGEILDQMLTYRPPGHAGETPWMLDVWDTDAGLGAFLALPSGPGNAGAAFKRIEELYPGEKDELDSGGADSAGVLAMLEAADAGNCSLSPDHYPVFDKTTAKQPDFAVLRLYLQALFRRAERAERRGDPVEAERCHSAAIICGWHLARDRSSVLVYMTGMIFKMRGAQGLETFLRRSGNVGRADLVKRYIDRTQEILRLFYWKANVALGEFDNFASLPAMLRIAAADKESCWRKEAVARLAVLRHGVPDTEAGILHRNPDFERAAEEALSAVVALDPDPTVRRLAIWATLNINPGENGFRHLFE